LIRPGQFRLSAGMLSAEHMVVDHNVVVTQVFRGLGEGLDCPGIAAQLDLRINNACFHGPLPHSRSDELAGCDDSFAPARWLNSARQSGAPNLGLTGFSDKRLQAFWGRSR